MDQQDPDPEVARQAKVSPYLRFALMDWERERKTALDAGADPATWSTAPTVRVLIELTESDTTELERADIDFQHSFSRFYAANVRLDRLNDLAALPTVLRIHHEQPVKPALDGSIPEIHASTVRNPQFPFAGANKVTGSRVVIGIIDSGINILHPVFRLPDDQSKTRILGILDQTQNPQVRYTKAQIEAAIAADTQLFQPGAMVGGIRVETRNNDHTHGTHVAGIAAGNGKIAGDCHGEFTYVGVAPEAWLVIVKYGFTGAVGDLQQAIDYIASMATAADFGGAPCVINMSFGHSVGPHDGTDTLDQMIDNYLSVPPAMAPVVLVAAAGNEGGHQLGDAQPGEDTHATGSIPPGGAPKVLRFDLAALLPNSSQRLTQVDIRFTAAAGLGCRLIPPGNNISAGSNIVTPNSAVNFTEGTQGSACSIDEHPVPGGAPGARRIIITITSTANHINQPGEWRIELTNASAAAVAYHAWISGPSLDRFKDDLSQANTISSPGSATSIITVGNYSSSWKRKGQLEDRSGRGPRLDGVQKPDLSAPGVSIISAKREFHEGCCCDCCCSSYTNKTGTSMSAPHVTGAIALMLERNPVLTHQEIKTLLINNARRDSFTGPAPGNDFGAGKLDVLALLNDPAVRGTAPVIASHEAFASSARPATIPLPPLAALPKTPQLEEGTPLWRLLNTAEGRRLYELGRIHWDEVRALVNTEKRVAVVWHRNYGPLLLHHVTRTMMLPHVPLPLEVDGIKISIRAARMVSALERFASKELIAALHETLPLIAQLQGKTLLEVVEMIEDRQVLAHA